MMNNSLPLNQATIPEIELFSDGGASPNPGPGGYGTILRYGSYVKEYSQGFKQTTNNRMEILGVITGLEQLKKKSVVTVFSDSKYVVDTVDKGWVYKWKQKNWWRNNKEKAVNIDLWERLLPLLEMHSVKFVWVKGHNGHPENERCDELATEARLSQNLIDDAGYFPELPTSEVNDSEQILINGRSKGSKSIKVKNEGDPCRDCGTTVIRKLPKADRNVKPDQEYYFEYYLYCPNCHKMYMVEEAKRFYK